MWFRVLVTEINITWIGGKSLHLVVHGVTISWSQLRSCLLGVLTMKFLAEYKNPTLRTPNKHALILHIWNEDKLPCHEAFRRGFEVGENGKQNWCHIFCCLLLWTKGVFFSSQKESMNKSFIFVTSLGTYIFSCFYIQINLLTRMFGLPSNRDATFVQKISFGEGREVASQTCNPFVFAFT